MMRRGSRFAAGWLAAWLAVAPAWPVNAADDARDLRARIGLRMFRTVLASDIDLPTRLDAQGRVHLLVMHWDEPDRAKGFADELARAAPGEKAAAIRDLPVTVEVSNDFATAALESRHPAGIYIVQDLPAPALHAVIDYGIQHHVIVYSAIEGHVEKGVLGGIDVGVRVLPYINASTLQQSQVHLKDLFLKVAKRYE